MKNIMFVLPVCIFFAFCSSSKKAATPVKPGISNVNVSRNNTMVSAANVSSSLNEADKEIAYTAKHDTALNGMWVLEGMAADDGSWSDTHSLHSDSAASATSTDTAIVVSSDTTATAATSENAGKTRKEKYKNKGKTLYNQAQARLNNMNYKLASTADTSSQPFKYWNRTPSVTFNATNLIFTGNTGCNSMSGSFNFNDRDIRFGRNIITSKMSCNEYNETNFLSALKKADNYTLNGNMLELKQGSTRVLAFERA